MDRCPWANLLNLGQEVGFSFVGPVCAQPCLREPQEGSGRHTARADGEEVRESFRMQFMGGDGGLLPVLVGLLCSGHHGESKFLLLL